MRIFVKYNRSGEVLSVSKVETMPRDLDHPYSMLAGEEAVLELPATEEYQRLDSVSFHEKYQVDASKKKLVKKRG